ncbi:hypothetical protein D3C74_466020 [compost metagenome]
MASTATGLIWSAGMDPAERTSTAPPDRARRNPAAIWERPALWTQTNKADGLSAGVFWVVMRFSGRAVWSGGQGEVG